MEEAKNSEDKKNEQVPKQTGGNGKKGMEKVRVIMYLGSI